MNSKSPQVVRTPAAQTRPSTKRRRLVMFAAVQLSMLIWMASSYLLAVSVFGLPQWMALGVAVGLGYLVFLVECVVIATPLNRATVVARLVLTVLMSALGSVAVDIALFRDDINARLIDQSVAQLQREQAGELERLQDLVGQATTRWNEAVREMNDEVSGRDGAVRIGCGPVCRHLEKQASERKSELREVQMSLTEYQEQAAKAVQAMRDNTHTEPAAGLLHRLAALHAFMRDHPETLLTWAALFFVVMLIESTVVIAKLAHGKSLEERLEALRETVVYDRAHRQQVVLCEPDMARTRTPRAWRRSFPTRLDQTAHTKVSTARSRALN